MNVSMLGWIMITHNVNTRVHLWASSLFHILFKLRAAQLLWTTTVNFSYLEPANMCDF